MKVLRMGFEVAAFAVAGACGREGNTVFSPNNGALAFTRFVNAVSDSGAGDWRFDVGCRQHEPVLHPA